MDLLSLLWAYSDAVSIVNMKKELPSVIYQETIMYSLSSTNTGLMLKTFELTGNKKLDSTLLHFHEQSYVKADDVQAILESLLLIVPTKATMKSVKESIGDMTDSPETIHDNGTD